MRVLPVLSGLFAIGLLSFAGGDVAGSGATADRHEFQIARLIYSNAGGGEGRGGWGRPWWAIDYPEAEMHFINGLRRLTRIDSADDSIHLQATDDALFDHPWLFVQQVGNWRLSDEEAARLRDYLLRGGFLVVDDFHGQGDWDRFYESMRKVFPDRPVVDLPEGDEVMHVLYDLNERTQIPGCRHLPSCERRGWQTPLLGPATWRGIYDDKGRLMVVMNFNMDMGDSWEHADDPGYPEPMTALGYRFGINYILYAMTH